jgi:hypothetical protein
VKNTPALLCFALLTLLSGCAASGNSSDHEWQRAQCDRVVDREDREKCLKRADAEYGRHGRDEETPAKKR